MFAVSASFAADENVTLAEVDDEIAIDEDVLSVGEDSDALSVDDESSEIISTSNKVTNATFHDYFDDSGSLLDNVTADELEFEGDFTGLDVYYITIEKSIKLTGKNATFSGVSFVIDNADNVVIDGFKLYQDNDDTCLISIADSTNVTISNNVIDYKALDETNSFGIYALNVMALKIINNNITYVGNTNGTSVNNAIYVEGDSNTKKASKDIVVQGNTFDIAIPSIEVNYYTSPYTVYSEGIVFFFCEDVKFVDNRVDFKSNNFTLGKTSPDSIYVLSVKSDEWVYDFNWDDDDNIIFTYPIVSKNVIIADNTFNVLGNNYSYVISLAADNFTISNNKFNVTSGSYANAITLNGLASNGEVRDNDISVSALDAVYGLYAYQWSAPISDILYKNNTILAQGYLACGMELAETNTIVDSNEISAYGNYSYGIVVSLGGNSDKGFIANNTIYNIGTNVGVKSTGDKITPEGNSMAITVKSYSDEADLIIKENKVYSNNIGINVAEDSEIVTIEGNTIIATANSGKVNNYAIVASEVADLTIIKNNVTFEGLVDYQFAIVNYTESGWPIYDTSNNTQSYGVYIKNSDVVMMDNTFDINIPTFAVNWGLTREAFSEGIVLEGCDDLVFEYNNVTVNVNGGSSWDTIYGLDVLNSANPTVENNVIILNGRGYAYAIIINDEVFSIANNKIYAGSDNYACGIDVEGVAIGAIFNNTIVALGGESVYPIYSGMNWAPVNVSIVENKIYGYGYYVVGMEIAGDMVLVQNNTVSVNGNHTIGIASEVNVLKVDNNTIEAYASNIGNNTVYDYMGTDNIAILIYKGNALISNNTLYSNAIGIDIRPVSEFDFIGDNEISVIANSGKVNNFAIVAAEIEALGIQNNNISYYGLVDNQFEVIGTDSWGYPIYNTTANTKAYGIYIVNSNVGIAKNNIGISIPTFAVNWGATREAFSEGIVLVGCDDLGLVENEIVIATNGGSSWDTIYGIDILNSANATVEDNNITVLGIGYAYGIIINDNFTIEDNEITVTSDNYACGIDVEGTACGLIADNEINAVADSSAYPIYSGMNYMPVTVVIDGNDIYGSAYYVVGVEVGGDEALITDNTITVEGNHTIGIGSAVKNLTVEDNTIVSEASNEGDLPVWDNMGTDTTGIKVASGDFAITNNDVETTGDFAAVLGESNGTISYNQLLSNRGAGNEAIIGLGLVNATGNPETNNKVLKVVLFANDLTKVYGSADQFIVKILDENGQPVGNKTIKVIIDGVTYTNTSSFDGVAAFDINLVAGNYFPTIKFDGDATYGYKSIMSTITVTAKPTAFTAPDATVLITAVKSGYNYKIVLKDDSGNVLADKNVTITFNGKTSTVATDSNGAISYKLDATKANTYKMTLSFAGDDKYAASSATPTIKINKEASKLTAKKKTFKKSKKVKKYTVTLKDSKGKAIKKAKLTLKIGKKTIKATTNAKGKATFKIKKLTKKGKKKATVKYAGNNLYKASTKKVVITIK